MPILSTLKPKFTAESTNATAAGLGRMICTKTTMKTYHNSVIPSGNGLRGGMGAMGSGRGSPMLYQVFRPSVAAGLKTCIMMMMTCSSVPTALATIKTCAAIPASSFHPFCGAVECGHPFPITCSKTLFLHKRKAHLDSQVKCCFASPESERTAFACCDSSENLLSLRNQSPLSTALNKSSGSLLSSRFLSFVGLNYPSNFFHRKLLGSYQFRNLNTTAFNMAHSNGSLARQNFHEDCEAHINKQINMELYASYVYMSMAYYFDREDVAFPGLHKWFKKASDEEREHAEKFMKYQNMRGGRIVLQPIGKPSLDEWTSPLEALSAALELERTVNQTLLGLHGVAGQHNDPQLCDFLETNFLEEQVHAIKELSDYVTRLKRVGKGLGEHLFDQELGSKAD